MQPLSPQKKQQILQANPDVTPDDIAEYESLLAAKFSTHPLLQRSPQQAGVLAKRQARLRLLKGKLFPELSAASDRSVGVSMADLIKKSEDFGAK
jgi:hypothetical protein